MPHIRVSCRIFLGAVALCSLVFSMPPKAVSASFSDVYRRVKPSVVYIVVATADGAQSGSGFIYDSNASRSIIVTADHVVAGGQRIDVILDSDVSKRYRATLLEHDRKRDVAFLEIPVGHRSPLRLAERPDIAEGNSIAVVGYPRAAKIFERLEGDDLRPSVHEGIVSAVRLNGAIIQFDAQVDHGDSGGPVVDVTSGKVVAIVLGGLLDRSYILAGLEKPLPGSAYGASSPTIYAVRNGLAEDTASESHSAAPSTQNSASYRVAFASPEGSNSIVQAMMDVFTQRIREHFTGTNVFYAIPASNMAYGSDSSKLQAFCDDLRVNALVLPFYNWQSDITIYGGATVTTGLVITDCYGVPFYAAQRSKSESRFFANRSVEREVIDMGNDLIDRMLSDFNTYRETRSADWENLLRYGIAADPKSVSDRVLVGVIAQDKQYRVKYLRPEGLGQKAGLAEGDIIYSIDGQPPNASDTGFQVAQKLESATTVVVRRPDGDITITIRPSPSIASSTNVGPLHAEAQPSPTPAPVSGTQTKGSESVASPAAAPVMAPPRGWTAGPMSRSLDGVNILGFWRGPSSSGGPQTLTVVAQGIPSGMQPSEFARLTQQGLERSIGAENVAVFKPARICNGTQDGWYIESHVLVGIQRVVAEQTIGVAGAQSFVATYRRPADVPEDQSARRALDTLCPTAE